MSYNELNNKWTIISRYIAKQWFFYILINISCFVGSIFELLTLNYLIIKCFFTEYLSNIVISRDYFAIMPPNGNISANVITCDGRLLCD